MRQGVQSGAQGAPRTLSPQFKMWKHVRQHQKLQQKEAKLFCFCSFPNIKLFSDFLCYSEICLFLLHAWPLCLNTFLQHWGLELGKWVV